MVVMMVIVIPIVIEFSPEKFLHILLELLIETENEIIIAGESLNQPLAAETNTDNNINETDNNLIEETEHKN
jgi:hypothetical protein